MFVVHGTKKFLDRAGGPTVAAGEVVESTTVLGSWYVTVLFWGRQVGLFVNETTLLPVLTPLAPAATVLDRFPDALAQVLDAHGVDRSVIEAEVEEMADWQVAKTSNRRVVGIMNEFAHLGDVWRSPDGGDDLVALSLRLATVPCSPLYGSGVSPDRELIAYLAGESEGLAAQAGPSHGYR